MTRTCDLRFRKPSLYPAELRDRIDFIEEFLAPQFFGSFLAPYSDCVPFSVALGRKNKKCDRVCPIVRCLENYEEPCASCGCASFFIASRCPSVVIPTRQASTVACLRKSGGVFKPSKTLLTVQTGTMPRFIRGQLNSFPRPIFPSREILQQN
jgi:hypothetical protein